ncbi:MAG: MOSC domain-containing protein [Myxococcota bacterium]
MKLKNIYISASSNFWGRKPGDAGTAPTQHPKSVECHQGRGLVGDRYYDFKTEYGGQVSIMSEDALLELRHTLGREVDFSVFRRNLIVSGIDPLVLVGKKFSIGSVQFEGSSDCTPCEWMDFAAGEGTYAWLDNNNKGGLRAKILNNGTITIGDQLKVS